MFKRKIIQNFEVMKEEKKIINEYSSPSFEQNNLTTSAVVNQTFDNNLDNQNSLRRTETTHTISIDSIAESVSENNHDELVQANETPLSPQLLFGNIAVQNASDVTFGNKSYYQGPITIKQCLHNGNVIPKLTRKEIFRQFIVKRKRFLSVFTLVFIISLILLLLLFYWRKNALDPDFSHPGK